MLAQAALHNGAIALSTSSCVVLSPLEWPEQPSQTADVVIGGIRLLLNLRSNVRLWLVHPMHNLAEKRGQFLAILPE